MKTSFYKSVIVQVHYDKSNSTLVLYKKHRVVALSMNYYYYYRKKTLLILLLLTILIIIIIIMAYLKSKYSICTIFKCY